MPLPESLQSQLLLGPMPFAEFMQQALYSPLFGYYSGNLPKLGASGDFVTAPELTPLFGQTLAIQCADVLPTLETPHILEFGAGSGQLCVDILQALEASHTLPESYRILEVSASLKARQEALIASRIPHLADRVCWLSALPETPFQGVIIANEVLDAMPVHRFMQTEEGIFESFVRLDNDGKLAETFLPATDARLCQEIRKVLPPDRVPYISEINLLAEGWIAACANMLGRGLILLLDYGFPAHEYYHPDRTGGTLMCHHQHRAHPDALRNPGEQDITAHVNFTRIAESAEACGLEVAGFTSQAAFLLNLGILELASNPGPQTEQIARAMALKQLLMPSEMGELFKVMALTKNSHHPLRGFQQYDKRASLCASNPI